MKRIMYMFAAMLILVSVGSCEKDPVPAPEDPGQEQNPGVKPEPEPEPEIPEYSIAGDWKEGLATKTDYKLDANGEWVQEGETTELDNFFLTYLHVNEDGTYNLIDISDLAYDVYFHQSPLEKKEKNLYVNKKNYIHVKNNIEFQLVAENKMVETETVMSATGDSKSVLVASYELLPLPEDLAIDLKAHLTGSYGQISVRENTIRQDEHGLWYRENLGALDNFSSPTLFIEYQKSKLRTLTVDMTAKTAIQNLYFTCTFKGSNVELRKIKDKGEDQDLYLKELNYDRTDKICTFLVAFYHLTDPEPSEFLMKFCEIPLAGYKLPENSRLILENLKAFKSWKNTGNYINGKEADIAAPGTLFTYHFTSPSEGTVTMSNDKTTTIPFKIQKNNISVKVGGNTQQLVITDFKFDRMVIEQGPLKMIFEGQEPVS